MRAPAVLFVVTLVYENTCRIICRYISVWEQMTYYLSLHFSVSEHLTYYLSLH